MPTSSITRNFVITGKNKVEAFVNALEESANADVPLRKVAARQLTDPKEIKVLMMKAKKCRCEREESERTSVLSSWYLW